MSELVYGCGSRPPPPTLPEQRAHLHGSSSALPRCLSLLPLLFSPPQPCLQQVPLRLAAPFLMHRSSLSSNRFNGLTLLDAAPLSDSNCSASRETLFSLHTRACFLTVFVIFFFSHLFFHRVPRVLPQRLFPPAQRLPSMPAAGRAQREDGAQKHGGTRGRGRRALVPRDGRLKRRAQRNHDCSDSQRFIFQSSHAWVTIRQTNAAFYYIGCWSLFIHLAEAIPL